MAVRAQADLEHVAGGINHVPNMYASPGKYSSANWGARTMAFNGSMYAMQGHRPVEQSASRCRA